VLDIIYMTKHPECDTSQTDRPAFTDEMIARGVKAFRRHVGYDGSTLYGDEDIVRSIVLAVVQPKSQ